MVECIMPVSGGWQTTQRLTLVPDLTGTSGGWQTTQRLTLVPDLVEVGFGLGVFNEYYETLRSRIMNGAVISNCRMHTTSGGFGYAHIRPMTRGWSYGRRRCA